ncbi:MAG TPA: sulfatase-like hydrolase/transferase [Thermoanaerobaculia bacterium]|nr:sulfatase-like hydrolase/transferase [Thermoanaerobaculia bacterium]
MPLHLEDHLEAADIEGSEVPGEVPEPVLWRFDEPQPGWKPLHPVPPGSAAVEPSRTADALRLPLTEDTRHPTNPELLERLIYVELPDLDIEDWAFVEIRARASEGMRNMGLMYNFTETEPFRPDDLPFYSGGGRSPLVADGSVQTYHIELEPRRPWEGPWTHLAIWFNCRADDAPATLDVLSVRLVSAKADFTAAGVGVETVGRRPGDAAPAEAPDRRSLFMHTPGRVAYPVRIPEGARLDVGLGVLPADGAVELAVRVGPGSDAETLLRETYSDHRHWGQRSVDLSHLAGQTVLLALEADAARPGNVALWAAPTLSGTRSSERPNVIFYIIDGASTDYMSLYGYNRRTTPHLERIAAEGALFERAYSNSSWTRPSTASYMTSLQHSVLGGLRNGRNPVPANAVTMAEHMHRAGVQTAVLTSNASAGRMSDLHRGADVFRDAGVQNWSTSSVDLHGNFWRWREAYPGEPYWVHFQTTDVHNDHTPVAPFAGLFIDPERRRRFEGWLQQVNEIPETPGVGIREALDQLGIDQAEFWSANRDLHDESMAHQDHRLGQLVARLRASGEWERTLLIVASDHGVAAGAWDYRLLLADPPPDHVYYDDLAVPMVRSGVSRIPLIVVWPGRIAPGQRFRQPVSMIDALPTVLDLAGLPAPEVMMGQSLAPLLLGEAGWEPRPVILDEFELDRDTGELHGRIEVVDGRWGASLEIGWDPDLPPERRRPAPLLVYDLWSDPDCLLSLHQERPDLVRKYTRFLEKQWRAHRALAGRFTPAGESPLTSEQLQTLRALGYIE